MKFKVGDKVTVLANGVRTVVKELCLHGGVVVKDQGKQRINWFLECELKFTDAMEGLVKTRERNKCKK